MVYVTGDCHADFSKFSTKEFKDQKNMTKDDIVIICGDFGGIWEQIMVKSERYWLKWLDEKPFTTCYVDGNHENFDRYYSDEFPIVDFHGGKAQKISESVYHLMRGEIYEFDGKKFFCFGGASSHDIQDGILDPEKEGKNFFSKYNQWRNEFKMFRVKGISWWEEELPSEEEMQHGLENLAKVDFKVDYVISHCLPLSAVALLFRYSDESDRLTRYFDSLLNSGLQFKRWYAGHYHVEENVMNEFVVLYDRIERIL